MKITFMKGNIKKKKTELKAISQLTLEISSIYWDFVYPTLEFFQKFEFE